MTRSVLEVSNTSKIDVYFRTLWTHLKCLTCTQEVFASRVWHVPNTDSAIALMCLCFLRLNQSSASPILRSICSVLRRCPYIRTGVDQEEDHEGMELTCEPYDNEDKEEQSLLQVTTQATKKKHRASLFMSEVGCEDRHQVQPTSTLHT